MGTDMTLATRAFEPDNIDQAEALAKTLFDSGLLPEGVKRPQAAFAIIVTGRELGLTAMQSLRGIHIIEGKPTLAADTMLALALQSENCEYFQCIETTSTVATYETKRRGAPAPTKTSFSIEDAKKAKLLDRGRDPSMNNWNRYPAAMLRARCIAALARMVYPDVFMGIYDPDELQEREPDRVTVEVVKPPKQEKVAFASKPTPAAPVTPVPHAPSPPPTESGPRVVSEAELRDAHREGGSVPMTALPMDPVPTPQAGGELTTLQDFLDAIANAASIDVLKLISVRVSKVGLESKDDMDTIRAAWVSRRNVIAAEAKGAA
jgi:hypothetical protein